MKFLLSALLIACSALPAVAADTACESALALYRTYLSASDAHWRPQTAGEFSAKLSAFATPECLKAAWREKTEALYDPILQAQDWSPDWKKHLTAELVHQSATQRTCRVTIDPGWPQLITVQLKKIGSRWLITNFSR